MQKGSIVAKPPARVKRTPCAPTYDRWVLTSLVPATGWQAVFYDDEGHLVTPVHVLALGYRRRYDAHTAKAVRTAWLGPEDEAWEILALSYDVADGWILSEEASNFCGLLAPGVALEDFEQGSLCRYQHEPQRQVAPASLAGSSN